MADVRPFPGIRFDPARVSLGRALCPPYDVIPQDLARRYRADPGNAIHLELPEGEGEEKYQRAAALWADWTRAGLIAADPEPSVYVCEERFRHGGRGYRRLGFLAALGVSPRASKQVICHERTLSKPKEDRLNLLRAVRANISPIFGLVPDASGAVRRSLSKTRKRKPDAFGKMSSGVVYRLWRVGGSEARRLCGLLKTKKVLIADGHHRFAVSQELYRQEPTRANETLLAYLCPEEDSGLVMLPTHRVVAERRSFPTGDACRSLKDLLGRLERSRNPYACGIYDGSYALVEPRSSGCRSGMGVEYVAKGLLKDVPPDVIRYTHEARTAKEWADAGGVAVLVKSSPVGQIRKAVASVGLLPQKSTYFYPKVATGLVFKKL